MSTVTSTTERKLNLRAMIDKAAKDPEKLKDIRGQLAPTLRDTIVGYNYIHYAPPGAQILLTNPLFVRGHDFIGMQGANRSWRDHAKCTGPAGPRMRADAWSARWPALPYALAEAEQNFLVPTQTQALIWGDLVPQMMLTRQGAALLDRDARADALGRHPHASCGRRCWPKPPLNPARRDTVYRAGRSAASPWRGLLCKRAVASGRRPEAIDLLTPSETVFDGAQRLPVGRTAPPPREIAHYRTFAAEQVSSSESPRLGYAQTDALEFLPLRAAEPADFPHADGLFQPHHGRKLGIESALLGRCGGSDRAPPAQLNVLVPEWTQKVVERIFASHLEDWPALLRSCARSETKCAGRMRSTTAGGQQDRIANQ